MQHLFHKVTSLDMIRLYLTPKDKDKDKDIGHSPKLGQAKGVPLPEEIYSSFLFFLVLQVSDYASQTLISSFRDLHLRF